MSDGNRTAIVLIAAVWVILMALVIYLTWAHDQQAVSRLRDWVDYLDRHRDTTGRLIVTLAASAAGVLALFVIVLDLAPEEQAKELRVERAGATTIVPAEALRMRLREALMQVPGVRAAAPKVSTRDKGIATELGLTLDQGINVAQAGQEATRIATDIIQGELGLPLSGLPTVRVNFAPGRSQKTAASSVRREPAAPPAATRPDEPELGRTETVDERFEDVPEPERPAETPAAPPPVEGEPGEHQP